MPSDPSTSSPRPASDDADAGLAVDDLVVRYGTTTAVDGVSLRAAPGEVVALLGPSGCGKSSLLRAVAGLEAHAGQVHLDGRDLTAVPPHRRGLGLMFQGDALFPHRDVGANVAFGLRMQGVDPAAARERVAAVLALVGLPGTERRAVDTLSGGEQQRVALARAIAPRPRLLMLDEPLSSVDRALRDRLVEELPAVFAEVDAAVLYVTHDQAEALALADRVVVMRDGAVEQAGPPPEVWRDPATAFVARFLGQRVVDEGVTVADGVARTPLGVVPAPGRADGPAALVVPPGAVVAAGADAAGSTLTATVRARRFAGDHVVVLATTDAGLEVEVAWTRADWPAVGEPVRLELDVARLRLLDPA